MGLKQIINKLEDFLGEKKRKRRKKVAKLKAILELLEAKREKLRKRIEGASGKQKHKLEARLYATERHLEKGRKELEKLTD